MPRDLAAGDSIRCRRDFFSAAAERRALFKNPNCVSDGVARSVRCAVRPARARITAAARPFGPDPTTFTSHRARLHPQQTMHRPVRLAPRRFLSR
jgi:hypothetical protein